MEGKLKTFLIEFDNPTAVYYAGQVVNGRVLVVLNEAMKMRAIYLNFNGLAYTYWSDATGVRGRTVPYSDSELYIDTTVILWGKAAGASGDDPIMQPGSYQLPFSFTLPANCPSSYEGLSGFIRYVCKAVIDKPWKFNHTTKRAMTVISLVDLNLIPKVQVPVTDENTKALKTLCCTSGTISCSFRIPRTGFVPGEVLPIDVEVVNNSSTKISEVKVILEENVDFHGGELIRTCIRSVAQMKKGSIEAHQTQIWKNEGMRLPPIASTSTRSRIVKINYFLHVNVDPSGAHTDLSIRTPIVIGSIPLRSVMQELNEIYHRSSSFEPSGSANRSVPFLPSYPELPPPSYQETVHGHINIKEAGDSKYTMGQMSYAPKYPYYDWSPTQFAPSITIQ